MKNLKENRNTFPNWMHCKKTEIHSRIGCIARKQRLTCRKVGRACFPVPFI